MANTENPDPNTTSPKKPNNTERAVAAYLRVSSEEQRERATIKTQRVEIEKYATAHGITQISWYADDGWSGRKLTLRQRPDGARLLADLAAGSIDTVTVYRVDRLGRGRKMLASLDELAEASARYIISVTEAQYDLRNPNDEFHLTMLSGVSGYEATGFIRRSVDATNRLAREGVWLGGIVPYGYRVEGKGKEARLVVSEEPLPLRDLTEAGVVRLIYRRTVEDNWPCQRIADELNALNVPPAYQRDGRLLVLRGKRAAQTQGIWRAGRIRNMLVNTTYKGLHVYGKRTGDPDREVIERQVPAIVDADTWERAQQALHAHQLFSLRNAKHDYLLRGLVKCGLCGLTYSGIARGSDSTHRYYRCNGSRQARGLYGATGHKCPSKSVDGEWLEAQVWADVEVFLRDPGDILAQLAEQMNGQGSRADALRDELAGLKMRRGSKQAERDTVVSLYRRERIDAATLDRQLDQITEEESDLDDAIAQLDAALMDARHAEDNLRSADTLLRDLRTRLDAALDFATRRRIIETLVGKVAVDTETDEQGRKQAVITVRYRFDDPKSRSIVTRTGTDSLPPRAQSWRGR